MFPLDMIRKIFRDKRVERVKERAIVDMSNFLVNYGFQLEEAVKVSKEFWGKHEKNLKELL
jgi:hypothetical protein